MKNNGGLAFPRPSSRTTKELQDGMTLLDWFAGQAMNGVLSNSNFQEQDIFNDELSQWAYRMAHAMIKSKESLGD
jgi:hypothetical protein